MTDTETTNKMKESLKALKAINKRLKKQARIQGNKWLDERDDASCGWIDDHKYWILPSGVMSRGDGKAQGAKDPKVKEILDRMYAESGLSGYIHFKKRPVKEKDYHGIMNYVPVWGGLTYAREDKNGIVYGFDTAHSGQERILKEIKDPKWIRKEIRKMYDGILRAKKVEARYLKERSNKKKAKYVQFVYGKRSSRGLGFGAMIQLLGGKL